MVIPGLKKKKDILLDFQGVDQFNSDGLSVMMVWLSQEKRLNKLMRFLKILNSLLVIIAVCRMIEILEIEEPWIN